MQSLKSYKFKIYSIVDATHKSLVHCYVTENCACTCAQETQFVWFAPSYSIIMYYKSQHMLMVCFFGNAQIPLIVINTNASYSASSINSMYKSSSVANTRSTELSCHSNS